MKNLLLFLFFAWACTRSSPELKEQVSAHSADTLSQPVHEKMVYEEVEDTTTPRFSSVYAFLDSVKPYCGKDIHQFMNSWYGYTWHGNDYKVFQQFGVVFPFQYVIQDSVGAEKTLILTSVNDFAACRKNQYPGLHAWGLKHLHSPRRVVWEAYPDELYGNDRTGNIAMKAADGKGLVTYLFPKNKVDYYFRKEDGLWRVFKRVQKKYSQQELEQVADESFEGFLLRFISDKPFRLSRIKWPHVEYVNKPLQEPRTIITAKKDSYFNEPWTGRLMHCYEGFQKNMVETDTMYIDANDEGGVNYGHNFTKINNRWTLIESWDASN